MKVASHASLQKSKSSRIDFSHPPSSTKDKNGTTHNKRLFKANFVPSPTLPLRADDDEKSFNYTKTYGKLSWFYQLAKKQLLCYQSSTTGLFPRLGGPGTFPFGYIRDSLYCATAVWSLSQAYKRIDDDGGRTHELGQAAVKCMRGVLACWMRQCDRVEKFKISQSPENSLHVIFHLTTGNEVYKDSEYNHMQVDVVSMFLLYLVQMIQSGLQIIFTTDEVTFVQNLVFYVERAYRTPDFGMWERGSKYNRGESELHASTIGITKAALEAVNGFNAFGYGGKCSSTLFIDIDAHYRNRATVDNLLPRESFSKNTDASLLPTVSWPAFAIHEESLINRTISKIIRKLKGNHGFKRFLRDGFKTAIEEQSTRHYEVWEVKLFDSIECEWPMFFAHMVIDSIFRNDKEKADYWQDLLMRQVPDLDFPVLPQYFYVPRSLIKEEQRHPGSQVRVPSPDMDAGRIFLWGQSVFIISQLLMENILSPSELDPLRRYLPAAERPRINERYSSFQSSPSDLVVQMVLISESVRLHQTLNTYGIQTQTPHQVEPVQIWPPSMLVRAFQHLGVNQKMKLTGRPARPIGGLGTAKVYRTCGNTFVSYPLLFEVQDFYSSLDMEYVIDDIKSDLHFLAKCWKLAGRPTFCMIIREENLRGSNARFMFELLSQFKRGDCAGIKVRLGRLQEFLSSACMEHLDFLSSNQLTDIEGFFTFKEKEATMMFRSLTDIPNALEQSHDTEDWVDGSELVNLPTHVLASRLRDGMSMYFQCQILEILWQKEGWLYELPDGHTVRQGMEDLMIQSALQKYWAVTRRVAAHLEKVVDSLAPSITTILVRGKQVALGMYCKEEKVIDKPMSPSDIAKLIYESCYKVDPIQATFQQEMIINIGKLCTTNPEMFDGILRIRIGWIIEAMKLELLYTEHTRSKSLNTMSPSGIKHLLVRTLTKHSPGTNGKTVLLNRQLEGALNRTPADFYDRMWEVLKRCPAGIRVGSVTIPQQPTLSDMTQYELKFSLAIDEMLSKVTDVAFKQMLVEGFMVVAAILERNPELSFNRVVNMDKMIHEAFDLFWEEHRPEGEERAAREYKEAHPNVLLDFYSTVPNIQKGTTSYIAKAIMNSILDGEFRGISETQCILQ